MPSYRHQYDLQLATIVKDKTAVQKAFEKTQSGFVSALAVTNKPTELIKAILPSLSQLGTALPFLKPNPNVIRVKLDANVAVPGDPVRGYVKLMISEPVPVQDLSIKLYGRLQTYSGLYNAFIGRIPFESQFTLVNETKELELETKVLAPKIYDVPFEIDLPRTVTITEDDWPFNEETARFNSNLTQPLPPSFKTYSTAHAHVDCSIKYYVVAELKSREEKQDITHKVPLIVRLSDSRALMGNTIQSTSYMKCPFTFKATSAAGKANNVVLQPGNMSSGSSIVSLTHIPSSPTTPGDSTADLVKSPISPTSPGSASPRRNKFKDFTKDNLLRFTLPQYCFDLDAEIPRGGSVAQTLPIKLKLGWHPPKSKKLAERPPPPMILKAMQVQLQCRFMTRGVASDHLNDMMYFCVDQKASWHCLWRSQPLIISELKNPIELDPEQDMSELMFVHPHKFIPAFKSFSIAREYVLNVVCELSCAGETFKAIYEVDGFNIMADSNADEDDFFVPKPKLFRRPGAQNTYDDEEEEEEAERQESGNSSDSEDHEPGKLIGAEDELFQAPSGKKTAGKISVTELFRKKTKDQAETIA